VSGLAGDHWLVAAEPGTYRETLAVIDCEPDRVDR
jgi:hypothetical protein